MSTVIDLLERTTKKHLKQLGIAEAAEVLANLKSEELRNWFFWQAGMEQWKSVKKNDELMAKVEAHKLQAAETVIESNEMTEELPPLPHLKAAPEPEPSLVKSDDATEIIDPSSPTTVPVSEVDPIFKERRQTKRFDINFRLMITNGSESFISCSNNISLGGIKLTHDLPASFAGQECEIFVMNSDSKESVQLACRIVGTATELDRISFSGGNAEVVAKLNSWLLNQIDSTKNKKVS